MMGNNGGPPTTSSSSPSHSSSSPLVPNMEAIMAAAKIQRNPSGTGEHVPVSNHDVSMEDLPSNIPSNHRDEKMEFSSLHAS